MSMHFLNRSFRNADLLCVFLALLNLNFGNVNNQWCSFHLFACISEMLEMWTGPLGTAEEAHRGARKHRIQQVLRCLGAPEATAS